MSPPSPRDRRGTLPLFGGFLRRSNLFILLILAWGFGYLLFFGNNSLLYHFLLERRIRTVTATIADLERETAELAAEVQRIKTDPLHLELIARKAGYIRPGEVAYRIEHAQPTPQPQHTHLPPALRQAAVALPVLLGLVLAILILRLRNRRPKPQIIPPGAPHA